MMTSLSSKRSTTGFHDRKEVREMYVYLHRHPCSTGTLPERVSEQGLQYSSVMAGSASELVGHIK